MAGRLTYKTFLLSGIIHSESFKGEQISRAQWNIEKGLDSADTQKRPQQKYDFQGAREVVAGRLYTPDKWTKRKGTILPPISAPQIYQVREF